MGDRVYVWRSVAGEKDKAGVIAEAKVISSVAKIPSDEHGAHYWLNAEEAHGEADRVWLQLVRRGSGKEILRRDWLLEDPVLKDMLILRQATGTNFPLTNSEDHRLAKMWARVGQDWSRNESLAGLWAYATTYGGEVSSRPGSPVAEVSRVTGRAISGVYNKVMNFRHIDPRDSRSGLAGAGRTDRVVWAEYFDVERGELRIDALNEEFLRVWGDPDVKADPNPDAEAINVAVDLEADKLADKPLSELLDAYNKQKKMGRKLSKPSVRAARSVVYDRSPLVIAIAKARAGGQCEVPGCLHPAFLTKDGKPYVEVHHLVPLAEGGEDTVENVACLCPAHHREAHLGKNAATLLDQLMRIRRDERIPVAD